MAVCIHREVRIARVREVKAQVPKRIPKIIFLEPLEDREHLNPIVITAVGAGIDAGCVVPFLRGVRKVAAMNEYHRIARIGPSSGLG